MSPYLQVLEAAGRRFRVTSLEQALPGLDLAAIPRSLRILFENVARRSPEALPVVRAWVADRGGFHEIPFYPARVLMHDTTCVPALADFAALRDALAERGADPACANPVIPVDLVIDHSVAVDHYARADAVDLNMAADFRRNAERYAFVKWATRALANFRVVPPGTGILHQLNLEFLATVVRTEDAQPLPVAFPDTLLGTDSHTPMINAMGVLGWGVGGIEGQAAMLGQPIAVRIPAVVGVRFDGRLAPGVTATDLVLTVTERLRAHGVIGKFVEFFGGGVGALTLADRATVSNMAPEYGATCAYFPIDPETLAYLRFTGREAAHVDLVESYARAQGLWMEAGAAAPVFDDLVVIDLASVEPCLAGPTRPDERTSVGGVPASFLRQLPSLSHGKAQAPRTVTSGEQVLEDGAVALAAVTSCTNTSNPALVVAAGLLARKARALGLRPKPWVKTSFSPGSQAVSAYLDASGLQEDLSALGFDVVGFGCMTCIGNSGSLAPAVIDAVEREGLCVVGVLSGNRNFHGRVNPHLAGAYLGSPALVVAYALAGNIRCDLEREPLGADGAGKPVFLRDLWPSDEEVSEVLRRHVGPELFGARYADVWKGSIAWRAIPVEGAVRFHWDARSSYIRPPPYFEGLQVDSPPPLALRDARVLMMLGDSVTTDHISPAGAIPRASLAGEYLAARDVPVRDFNQYSARRGNHEVMLRGAFSNPRLFNELVPGPVEATGGVALPENGLQAIAVFLAAQSYRERGMPLVILAGRDYGAGSSRDWAAKAPALLGVRAILAEGFERLHRSNLIGMGILPLTFAPGSTRRDVCRDGRETLSFGELDRLRVGLNQVPLVVAHADGNSSRHTLHCRIDSRQELDYLAHGGLLPFVFRHLWHAASRAGAKENHG